MTTTQSSGWLEHIPTRLARPVDAASLGAFRILFGAVMTAGLIRYVANGWIDVVFVEPTFFFKYPGFEWVYVPGPTGLKALFAAAAISAACVTVGLFYRIAIVGFLATFTYIQLMDVTNYLNHYVLVVLLAALMALMPLDRVLPIRARRSSLPSTVPVWMLWLLRFQVAMVYLHAALAKVGVDWLVYGQPLNLWMNARTGLPVIGAFLHIPEVALAMSWAGFLYDLSIVPLLLFRRTRALAYATVLVFHAFTWLFFDIGMFPFIMVVATTLFFEPDWPRRLLRLPSASVVAKASAPRLAWVPVVLLGLYCSVQALVPLRHWFYPGEVLWNERGMRFAWKVMVREKNGSLAYRVRDRRTGREWQASPHRYLDWRQVNEMSSQPDLIVQLAHHIAADFRQRGVDGVEVRADSWVSLNGRRPARMLDPEADLLKVDVRSGSWILPAPREPPARIEWASGRKQHE